MWSEKNWNGAVLAVLLAHEQHRHERREQRAERRQRAGLGRQPVAERAVADLVVVLVEDHEPLGRHVVGRRAEPAAAEARPGAVVDERPVQALGQVGDPPELGVVAVALVGDERADAVVEVVGPGGVAAEPAAPPAAASPSGRSARTRRSPARRGATSCTRRAIAATMCSGEESKIAWMASRRSPSIPKSATQPAALWSTHSRTASHPASS